MKLVTVLCAAFFGLVTGSAKAATLTSTFQFTASGTIGTQSFTNASISITMVGDTTNRQTNFGSTVTNPEDWIRNDSVTISISGVGTFQVLSPATAVAVANNSFSDNLPPGGVNVGSVDLIFSLESSVTFSPDALLYAWYYPQSASWDMMSSLGPFATSRCYSIGGWNSSSVVTNGGTLNLYDVAYCSSMGSVSFQATVTPTVAVTPTQFNLSYQIGSVLPVGVLQVSGMGSAKADTVSASASGNWLSANPTSGTTPVTGTSPVTVNISPSGLNAGPYNGTVSVTQNGATVIVPVNLTVTSAPIPNPYDVNGDGVVNIVDIQKVINAALGGGAGQ